VGSTATLILSFLPGKKKPESGQETKEYKQDKKILARHIDIATIPLQVQPRMMEHHGCLGPLDWIQLQHHFQEVHKLLNFVRIVFKVMEVVLPEKGRHRAAARPGAEEDWFRRRSTEVLVRVQSLTDHVRRELATALLK
jgi:hypothetical protein